MKNYLDCLIAVITFFWIFLFVISFPPIIFLFLMADLTLALLIWRTLKGGKNDKN